MDAESLLLDAFKEAVTRLRWFLMTAVLVSALILIHTYIEQFSFQRDTLAGLLGYRIENHIEMQRACLQKHVLPDTSLPTKASLPECDLSVLPQNIQDAINANNNKKEIIKYYSQLEYLYNKSDNTFKNEKVGEMPLPLLGISVPDNDYMTIMGVMLLIFSGAVWFNLRSVYLTLQALNEIAEKEGHWRRLSRVLFTMTAPVEAGKSHNPALLIIKFVLWSPFLALLLSFGLDAIPLYNMVFGEKWYLGSMLTIIIRESGLFCLLILLAVSASFSTALLNRVEETLSGD